MDVGDARSLALTHGDAECGAHLTTLVEDEPWLLYVELGELVSIFGSASSVTATVPAGTASRRHPRGPDFDMTLSKDLRADTP